MVVLFLRFLVLLVRQSGVTGTGGLDLQLGSSFTDELMPVVFPYNSQHLDYYVSSGHMPSNIPRSGEPGRGKGVGFTRDTTRSVMRFVRESRPSSGRHSEPGVAEGLIAGKKKGKTADDDSWIQRGPAPGAWDSIDIISIAGNDPHLPLDIRASCYVLSVIGNSVFTDKNGNIVPYHLWPLVKNFQSPYIYQFKLLGTTRGSSVLDYQLRLDIMRACEVRCTSYMAQEIEETSNSHQRNSSTAPDYRAFHSTYVYAFLATDVHRNSWEIDASSTDTDDSLELYPLLQPLSRRQGARGSLALPRNSILNPILNQIRLISSLLHGQPVCAPSVIRPS
ncbi:hypothetical protein M9H77_04468 [Catharanthus roseus]|uniref:Uncharacterized protein n=1 Tax=Catharanthus roseus TaxID=4058 RepID=A0ACC0CE84_CATRO|nr:hypothetical protein M9H77_04468 [Catharanthus roseus]